MELTSDAPNSLRRALAAGGRLIQWLTIEESRALTLAHEISREAGLEIRIWTATTGLDDSGLHTELDQVVARASESSDRQLWVLCDATPSQAGLVCLRRLRMRALADTGPTLLLIDVPEHRADHASLPELSVHHLPLPGVELLRDALEWSGRALERSGVRGAALFMETHASELALAARGLSCRALERVFADCVDQDAWTVAELRSAITQAKREAIPSTRGLSFETAIDRQFLGGLGGLEAWLDRRRLAFEPRARALGIAAPRGVLLMGVQGCGKSLAARACADLFDLPLLRLDIAQLFEGTVGSSETNTRRALQVVDALAPTVLWLDEVDKTLGSASASRGDAGTTSRVIGQLLSWLQDREGQVFVVATANNVQALPPELLRKGRLDEVFFIDLPGPDARAEIAEIHLIRRPAAVLGQPPPLADDLEHFKSCARGADGYSGAEIEAAITEARLRAFEAGRPPQCDDFSQALGESVPLQVSHAEHIENLRNWASSRSRKA